MGAMNLVGIGLSDRPACLHRLVESIPGLLKSLKIPFLFATQARGKLDVLYVVQQLPINYY
jgi:hypothetical protein